LDATQTSEPTEAEPGSAPGQASAYRRALDDQAIATEGPLDLTVPLDIAKIRAALATTGPFRRVGLAVTAAPKNASAGSARPGRGHRRMRQAAVPSRRIGRIALFVAVTAALSVGTAWTLVVSTNAQNTSVSLPASGAIPVAPSAKDPQSGGNAVNSGSTSATAAPSLSRSPMPHPPVPVVHPTTHPASTSASPTSSASATGTATADPTSAAGGTATATAPAGSGPSYGPGPTPTASWDVLYQDADESSAEQQETTSVQGLLLDLGYLTPWRHRSYIDSYSSSYTPSSDPSGYYGSATSDAVAQFQQEYSVQYTNQLGACDAATYQALIAVTDQSGADSGSQSQSTTQSPSAGD
jgi:hypothetical protein